MSYFLCNAVYELTKTSNEHIQLKQKKKFILIMVFSYYFIKKILN